jgi:hypothetical protein
MAEIWKPQTKDIYLTWIDTIVVTVGDKLSDWEIDFIKTINQQLHYKNLSESQANKLESIYVRHTH